MERKWDDGNNNNNNKDGGRIAKTPPRWLTWLNTVTHTHTHQPSTRSQTFNIATNEFVWRQFYTNINRFHNLRFTTTAFFFVRSLQPRAQTRWVLPRPFVKAHMLHFNIIASCFINCRARETNTRERESDKWGKVGSGGRKKCCKRRHTHKRTHSHKRGGAGMGWSACQCINRTDAHTARTGEAMWKGGGEHKSTMLCVNVRHPNMPQPNTDYTPLRRQCHKSRAPNETQTRRSRQYVVLCCFD